jgi:hypothetical protein
MHLQVRSKPAPGGGFAADGPGDYAVSQEYPPGSLAEMLGVLTRKGFNLRAAGGPRVELGGEFAFWVGSPDDDNESAHEKATLAAVEALKAAGYDAWAEDVEWMVLDDKVGTLNERLQGIAKRGLLVEEILVGTPGKDTKGKIPIQLRLVKTPLG